MSDQVHIDYFRKRAEQERQAAAVAKDPSSAKVHSQLATAYEGKVSIPAARPRAHVA